MLQKHIKKMLSCFFYSLEVEIKLFSVCDIRNSQQSRFICGVWLRHESDGENAACVTRQEVSEAARCNCLKTWQTVSRLTILEALNQ